MELSIPNINLNNPEEEDIRKPLRMKEYYFLMAG
jgi:hypothetical protein